MNERDVQRYLWREVGSSMCLLIPNYTPAGWFECDMFAVTKAGYFYEYEIKLTVADLRADTKKRAPASYESAPTGSDVRLIRIDGKQKHTLLAEGDERGPSLFWYVVPKDLVGPNDIAAWAGLVYINERGGMWVIKRPPRRHRTKVSQKIVNHARGVCYYRYWQERLKLDRRMAVGGAA